MRALGNPVGNPVQGAGSGGSVKVGDIAIFEGDPGPNYLKPDGRTLPAASYPSLAKILPIGGKLRRPVGANDVTPKGYIGQSIIVDGDVVGVTTYDTNSQNVMLRSGDRGANYARGVPTGGSAESLVAFGSTGYWYSINGSSFFQSPDVLRVSSDRGLSWSNKMIGNGTIVATGMFFLGAPWNMLVVIGGQSGNSFMAVCTSPGGDFTVYNSPFKTLRSAATNPATGATIFVGEDAVRRRSNPLDVNTTSTPSVDTGTLAGGRVKYAAGMFVVIGSNGIFVSRDDGYSFKQVSTRNFYCGDYGNGQWLFGSYGRAMYVGNGSLGSVEGVFLLPPDDTDRTMVDIKFTGTTWVVAQNMKDGLFYSLTANPEDGFIVLPTLGDGGLVSPKKYFMRAR